MARFDGGRLSSDAGLVCVWALDQQQRLTEDFAACIRDVRDGRLGTVKLTEAGCESHNMEGSGAVTSTIFWDSLSLDLAPKASPS